MMSISMAIRRCIAIIIHASETNRRDIMIIIVAMVVVVMVVVIDHTVTMIGIGMMMLLLLMRLMMIAGASNTAGGIRTTASSRVVIIDVFAIDVLRSRDEGAAFFSPGVALLQPADFHFCFDSVDEAHDGDRDGGRYLWYGTVISFFFSFGFLQAGKIDAESGSSSWRRV